MPAAYWGRPGGPVNGLPSGRQRSFGKSRNKDGLGGTRGPQMLVHGTRDNESYGRGFSVSRSGWRPIRMSLTTGQIREQDPKAWQLFAAFAYPRCRHKLWLKAGPAG
jgi:hypothetical protein